MTDWKNEYNHRCHAKMSGLKNTEKRLELAGALTAQETESGKKEKSDSVMQFHPRGRLGNTIQFFLKKC